MGDLEEAIRYALEPMTQQGRFELCAYCGATRHSLDDHVCRTTTLEVPGLEPDAKRRARSYTVG